MRHLGKLLIYWASMLLAVPVPTRAMDVAGYQKFSSEDFVKTFVFGVATGYSWANVVLVSKGQQPLYCQPPSGWDERSDVSRSA